MDLSGKNNCVIVFWQCRELKPPAGYGLSEQGEPFADGLLVGAPRILDGKIRPRRLHFALIKNLHRDDMLAERV